MEPYQIDNLIELIQMVVLIGTGTGAIAALMYASSRLRGRISGHDVKRITEGLDSIHQAIEDVRADQAGQRRELSDRLEEISGRVEFTERMLTKGKDDV